MTYCERKDCPLAKDCLRAHPPKGDYYSNASFAFQHDTDGQVWCAMFKEVRKCN